jgi:hypothetical protein
VDQIRDRSIIDNAKSHFTYSADGVAKASTVTEEKKSELMEKADALKIIMEQSFKQKLEKDKFIGDWKAPDTGLGILGTMNNEGNNCVFMSKYIDNVAIRWNKNFHPLSFSASYDKRKPSEKINQIKKSIEQEISEIIIEGFIEVENSFDEIEKKSCI